MHTIGRASRASLAALVATALVAAASVTDRAEASDPGTWAKDVVDGVVVAPSTPNPYLANLPTTDADFRSWNAYAAHRSAATAAEPPRGPRSAAVAERRGDNDSIRRAQPVFLDTGRDGAGGIDVIGRGPAAVDETSTDAGFAAEPNGSIPDAQVLPTPEPGEVITGSGTIGDEDTFDFDFLALPGLSRGDTIVVDIDTADPFGDLDPFVALWSDAGPPFPLVATNDDDGQSFDSLLVATIPADGDYYVSVGGFGAFLPADPFDPSSPSDTGDVGSQGDYDYAISLANTDVDHYKFRLDAGDVFGATVLGGSALAFYGPDDDLLIGSATDNTFIHPAASPLPGGGDASVSYVVDEAGVYSLAVVTSDDYVAELRAFRPVGDVPGRGAQVLFLDFDGGEVDTGLWGAPFGVVSLSPLSSFLPGWGLAPTDEDAVIDAIVEVVTENLEEDVAALGGNPAFDIEILNSRDHAEPTGPLVSRVVVGGSIPEFGIATIGIAESIDVGNFETEETAVVLLDVLSAVPGDLFYFPGVTLNDYALAPGASKIDLVGIGVGNITAHEAGHFFANWHTDQFNDQPNIMDQGGNLPGTIGVGQDLVFGSDDDVDVDFGSDVYVANEGFIGVEDTLTSIGFGLWSDGG